MGIPINPQILGPQIPMQQGQGPGGFPISQPGFQPPPPTPMGPQVPSILGAPRPPLYLPLPPNDPSPGDPEFTQVAPEVYEIDPLVLERKVRIRIEGSERMQSRAALQQMWPFLAQAVLNGPFLQGLAQQGQTVDFLELARMAQDAMGTQRSYRIFRPMNQQEQQMRQMPSPDMRAKMQMGQQEIQGRQQIMGQKIQGELSKAQLEAQTKNKAIDEESARHLVSVLQKEHSDQQSKPDPQMEARQQAVELQGKQQEQQMKLRQMDQEHALKMRQQLQKSQMDMHTQGMQHQMDLRNMAMQNQANQAKVYHTLAHGAATAQAAKMQPKGVNKPDGASSEPQGRGGSNLRSR